MTEPAPSRIRFGHFEVDTRSGELRRNGYKVDLQDQPFQALVLLLERPGEMVTRKELCIESPHIRKSRSPSMSTIGQPLRVLIAGDEHVIADTLAIIFRNSGFDASRYTAGTARSSPSSIFNRT
jgi:DNA-binding response OmpR family regulator